MSAATGNVNARSKLSRLLTERIDFSRREAFWTIFAASASVFVGRLADVAPKYGVSFFSTPALLACVYFIAGALLLALLFHRSGWIGMAAVTALVAATAVDSNADSVLITFAVFIATFLFSLVKGPVLLRVIMIVFVLVFVSALSQPVSETMLRTNQSHAPSTPIDAPPVIYVVLDEAAPDPSLTREGFASWSKAYARYAATKQSLPATAEPFLEGLDRIGYRLDIWSTYYHSLCRDGAQCVAVATQMLGPYADAGLDVQDQSMLLVHAVARTGPSLERVASAIEPLVPHSYLGPYPSYLSLKEFAEQSRTIGRGEAMAIHVLLPHDPYLLDGNCELLGLSDWVGSDRRTPLSVRREAYDRQYRCVRDEIVKLADGRAIVIVHGDHGSRIFAPPGEEVKRVHLLKEAYATTFAIFHPSLDPVLVDSPGTVGSLLENFVNNRLASLPEGRNETVIAHPDVPSDGEREMEFE